MAKYVQHISGQGEKWELATYQCEESDSHLWAVEVPGKMLCAYVPKSEYREVPPPEVWRDITSECEIQKNGELWHMAEHKRSGISAISLYGVTAGYRLRKVFLQRLDDPEWVFKVEKKVND